MFGTSLRSTALAAAGVSLLALLPAGADARTPFRGLSLEQAIRELQSEGLVIVYSNAFVKPWMRIRDEPTAADPAQALEQLLAPFGLRVRTGPHDVLAVVRGSLPREAPAPDRDRDSRASAAPGPPPLAQIVVAASRYELTQSLSASLSSLSATDIQSLPDVGEDALRAVTWLPGAGGNDISALIRMRGGDADENLVRFDGVRLYQP